MIIKCNIEHKRVCSHDLLRQVPDCKGSNPIFNNIWRSFPIDRRPPFTMNAADWHQNLLMFSLRDLTFNSWTQDLVCLVHFLSISAWETRSVSSALYALIYVVRSRQSDFNERIIWMCRPAALVHGANSTLCSYMSSSVRHIFQSYEDLAAVFKYHPTL